MPATQVSINLHWKLIRTSSNLNETSRFPLIFPLYLLTLRPVNDAGSDNFVHEIFTLFITTH